MDILLQYFQIQTQAGVVHKACIEEYMNLRGLANLEAT
jgi:hypothetical protein